MSKYTKEDVTGIILGIGIFIMILIMLLGIILWAIKN